MTKLGMFRGIAILAVVLNHAATHGMTALTWWANDFGRTGAASDLSWLDTPGYWALMSLKHLAQFCVPLFLFCSGFYVAYSWRAASSGLWAVVKASLRGLFIPFAFWSIISIALYLIEIRFSPSGRALDLSGFIEQRMKDYNFVPVLAELLLLVPLVVRLGARRPLHILAMMLALQVANSALMYARYAIPPQDTEFLSALQQVNRWNWAFFPRLGFFFFLGFYVARHYRSVQLRLWSLRWPLIAAVLAFGCLSIGEAHALQSIDGNYWDDEAWKASTFFYTLAVLAALLAWDLRRGWLARMLDRIGVQSYGIYLVHPIATVYADTVLSHAIGHYAWARALFPVVVVVAAVGIPWLVMWSVAHSPARRYFRILFGAGTGALDRPLGRISIPLPAAMRKLAVMRQPG